MPPTRHRRAVEAARPLSVCRGNRPAHPSRGPRSPSRCLPRATGTQSKLPRPYSPRPPSPRRCLPRATGTQSRPPDLPVCVEATGRHTRVEARHRPAGASHALQARSRGRPTSPCVSRQQARTPESRPTIGPPMPPTRYRHAVEAAAPVLAAPAIARRCLPHATGTQSRPPDLPGCVQATGPHARVEARHRPPMPEVRSRRRRQPPAIARPWPVTRHACPCACFCA